eukprot:1186934-Prorocentrum_minimum.AAC.4
MAQLKRADKTGRQPLPSEQSKVRAQKVEYISDRSKSVTYLWNLRMQAMVTRAPRERAIDSAISVV